MKNDINNTEILVRIFDLDHGLTEYPNVKFIRIVSEKYNLTVGKLIGLFVLLGGFSCVFNLYLHTYQKKGAKELIKNFLDGLPFYAVVIVPILYIKFHLDFYLENKWIVLTNACLLFARLTIDIQIKILTTDVLTCNIMTIFTNLVFILSLFIHIDIVLIYTLFLLLVAQIVELAIFIYKRAKEITDFLGIRIFCINPVIQI